MILTSTAFNEGEPIPEKYTCDGSDLSVPLSWGNIPAKTRSFALICDDPDAPGGTWVHWVLFNVPRDESAVPENMPDTASFDNGTKQGINSWGRHGYGGPCPPNGTHRYFFKLYALDCLLPLENNATKEDVLDSMSGHVIAEARLMGTYVRND